MSGDELKGLRDLRRARMGDVADIADQLLARQRIAYATLGEPPPPPPKPKRVRRCSPTSKATLQPWKADGVSRRTWYRRLKKSSANLLT